MRLQITFANEPHPWELSPELKLSVGGGPLDDVFLPSLPPALVIVETDGARVFLTCAAPVMFNGVLAPPRVLRLWLPAERMELAPGVYASLDRQEDRPADSATRAVVRSILASPESPVLAEARLVCLTGLDIGRVFGLTDGVMYLGRGLDAQIRVRDRSSSRRHAQVRGSYQAGWRVEDRGSPNGTYVNNRRLSSECELQPGDILEVGKVLLRFERDGATAAPRIPCPEDIPATVATKLWLHWGLGAIFMLGGAAVTLHVAFAHA